jgi:hypothetical protein
MSKTFVLAALALALGVMAGCATEQQMLAKQEPEAVQTALARGRFDLNCPAANALVLSSDFIQPAIQGPWVSGIQRLEYTVGIEGCGQRTTIVVMCQEGSSTCFAANPDERFRGRLPY